jgi:hypothetical protein
MFVVSSADVRRFSLLESAVSPDSAKPTLCERSTGSEFLEYFSNLYEPLAQFPLSQKEQAERQWSDLTDYGSGIYLLLAEADVYSLWSLSDRPNGSMDFLVPSRTIEQSPVESLEPLIILLLQTFWLVIEDLAGADRARAFGRDLLANRQIGIHREPDLQSYLGQKGTAVTAQLWQQGEAIVTEFETLAARYVGRDCAQQARITLAEAAIDTATPILEKIL